MDKRLQASGMAHLFAKMARYVRDPQDREIVEYCLNDYAAQHDCAVIPCSDGSFQIEPRGLKDGKS